MYHPVCGFLFFVAAAVVSMVLYHPLFLGVSFFCALVYFFILRGKKALGVLLKFLLPLTVVVTLLNALLNSYGVTVLFELPWGAPFTAEALLFGFCQAMIFSSVLLWLFCYGDVMTSEKFLYLFGRVFPNTALLFSMTLRFIPHFARRGSEIRLARRAAGIAGGHRLHEAVRVFSSLTTGCLESSVAMALSMRAKGYGTGERKPFYRYHFKRKDALYLLFLTVCLALLAAGGFMDAYYFEFDPAVYFETGPMFYLGLGAFFALGISPVLLDAAEAIKWRILMSKI